MRDEIDRRVAGNEDGNPIALEIVRRSRIAVRLRLRRGQQVDRTDYRDDHDGDHHADEEGAEAVRFAHPWGQSRRDGHYAKPLAFPSSGPTFGSSRTLGMRRGEECPRPSRRRHRPPRTPYIWSAPVLE